MTKKRIFRLILLLILTPILYIGIVLLVGTLTDFQPKEVITLTSEGGENTAPIDRDSLTLMCWNLGYAGLGADCNFFYDAGGTFTNTGRMVRPPKAISQKNAKGIEQTILAHPVDFYLLQEADVKSRRSYFYNQFQELGKLLPEYSRNFAVNFNCARVPLPIATPWDPIGKVYSGLATYSRWKPTEATRYQYPGKFGWPERIFNLDRCMAVSRYPVAGGKELVIINSHNSAYDKDGSLKRQEMEYIRTYILTEYAKGNYVIVGADWNQCPPGYAFDSFMPGRGGDYFQYNIANDFMTEGWQWVYDTETPTNRKAKDKFVKGETFVTLIDFYLVSPNLDVLDIHGLNMDFAYSDHQPVFLTVKLKK